MTFKASGSQDILVSTQTKLQSGQLWMGPTQPLTWRVIFPQGYSDWGVKLTTHFNLVLRLRIYGTCFHFPNAFMAWCLIKQIIRTHISINILHLWVDFYSQFWTILMYKVKKWKHWESFLAYFLSKRKPAYEITMPSVSSHPLFQFLKQLADFSFENILYDNMSIK
jgi:hypothetical protein